ncbi:class I SAM-dependent methyltransferase [Hasllibacter sp. MH4015]|uniref:class I SAM-dependent methyltransferase n=1 Tax=Hasllibacter sp. MH4015 TaxID=2854029 RepID=UPI001CD4D4E0|nr:class I SAM-dependent methyltransferase [Hasllibacter sp. MH4015]
MDWTAMAAPWLRIEADTDAAHAPVRHELMARANLKKGQRVLDIGPGAGITLLDAARAVGPDGQVTGIEVAPPFADRARERTPRNVDVIVADAQDHAFEPATFDAAISLFGVMFFRDSVAAFANIRRAMKPGAPLHFACWGPPERNPYFTMPGRVAAGVFGPGAAFDPTGPGPMRFGDVEKLHAILSDAGWSAEIETLDMVLAPPGSPEHVASIQMTIGAASMRIGQAKDAGTLTDSQRDAVKAGMVEGFAEMVEDGAVRVPGNFHFVRAVA